MVSKRTRKKLGISISSRLLHSAQAFVCSNDDIGAVAGLAQLGFRWVSKSKTSRQWYKIDLHKDENYFRFTRGHFLSNNDHEISQRYVRFNLQKLARVAAEAVGSKLCVSIEKSMTECTIELYLWRWMTAFRLSPRSIILTLNARILQPRAKWRRWSL